MTKRETEEASYESRAPSMKTCATKTKDNPSLVCNHGGSIKICGNKGNVSNVTNRGGSIDISNNTGDINLARKSNLTLWQKLCNWLNTKQCESCKHTFNKSLIRLVISGEYICVACEQKDFDNMIDRLDARELRKEVNAAKLRIRAEEIAARELASESDAYR